MGITADIFSVPGGISNRQNLKLMIMLLSKYPLQHFFALLLITNSIGLNTLTQLNVKSLKA